MCIMLDVPEQCAIALMCIYSLYYKILYYLLYKILEWSILTYSRYSANLLKE